ncbi:ComEC/Rec2 family competence protein [Oceanihabitans sediminis]|uniref:ComEC/Rec2 family competence protein n=1 Tax=Oceanihabitans sediminis TaxID=1812012 RepID=UPI00299D8B6F|nr:ComEC/Rec2 family competence protein [Oceanihabitans sediminis]MDX1278185.1 ComEC/Rec2 family competence protein [Oceanihabitans sediminis]
MKTVDFNIIKLSFFLVLGILLAFYFPISLKSSLYSIFGLLILLFTSNIYSRNRLKKNIWFGILAYMTTILMGVVITNFYNHKNHTYHYTKYFKTEENSASLIKFRVNEILKPSKYYDKYVVEILKIEGHSVTGKSLLNIQKDSIQKKLEVDEILFTTEAFQHISTPKNPNQFDYKKYLEKQYIYHQIFTKKEKLFGVSNTKHTLLGYASSLRNTINAKLKKYNFETNELAIINALILGQRQDISEEVYANYVNAGAVHILAVSGLHIGILLLIFNKLLEPIAWLPHGKTFKTIVILILLWSYAVLAGASASIIRSATMFSAVAIGMHLNRPSNVYNTLAASIFVILLFKPLFIFDVGFQLSYLAVLSIVSIQPLIYGLWTSKLFVVNKLWEIFSVTLAAQFGIVPISLFYFHQFPGLFWLSNIAIIPFIGGVLLSGIIIILLALLDMLPTFLADSFGACISLMNTLLEWIASKEQFLFQNISFNLLYVFASYLIIVTLVQLYLKKNFKTMVLLCVSIITFQLTTIYNKYKNNNASFILFHTSRNTVLGEKNYNQLKLYHSQDSIKKNKFISTFATANFIRTIREDSLKELYFFKNKSILVVDSLGIYPIKSIKPDYIILRNSPKVNLDRIIDSLKPQKIMADGSNYKSYIKRWEQTCIKRKLPFHHTSEKGAFILEN